MTNNLKWRLSKLPTPDEVRELVKDKIITQEEAREILFSQSEDRDLESLEKEIEFLRKLVERLSNKTQIIETIKYIEQPYYKWSWYKPYETWCSSGDYILTSSGTNTLYVANSTTTNNNLPLTDTGFSDIKTF